MAVWPASSARSRVRQVLAASGLSALEATASAWFEAQGIDSIDELREAETETELADALQLKPSRRKIFLKEVAKYNRTAAAAIMAARLVQDPPTLVRPARLRPATAAQAIDAATAVVSGPLLHFDMSRSSCVADERRLIKAGGKGRYRVARIAALALTISQPTSSASCDGQRTRGASSFLTAHASPAAIRVTIRGAARGGQITTTFPAIGL